MMFKKTKKEFQVAGSLLGGRGVAFILIAIFLTMFEKILGVEWYWSIPFVIMAAGAGFFFESKLTKLTDQRVFKRLDVVVEGFRYLGKESISLSKQGVVLQKEGENNTLGRLSVEHLCKTQKGHFFLLQYSHTFGIIHNITVIPCSIEMLIQFYPDVYERDFGVIEIA